MEGGNKKLMIYGRKQLTLDEETQEFEDGKMFDYIGVPYPEGYIDQAYTYVFNHTDITEVVFKGYENEEEDQFQEVLNQV